MNKIPIGIQLYTVREECAKDFQGTVRQLAEMGYEGIELAGDTGLSAGELNSFVTDLGLQIAGAHVGLEDLQNNLEAAMDYQAEAGNRRLVCPYLPQEYQDLGKEGYLKAAEIFAEVGEKALERGFSLSYHNHSFEFGKADGKYFLDILFEAVDSSRLKAELDTYWVQHGGENPAAYLHRYTNRVELLHIKDIADDAEKSFAEIGSGILQWDRIFTESEAAGVEWYLVEQDICPGPPLESVKKSIDYLKARGLLG